MDRQQEYLMSPVVSPVSSHSDLRGLRGYERKPVPYTSSDSYQGSEQENYPYQPGTHENSSEFTSQPPVVARSSALKWWWIEILCALLALIFMVVLAGLLKHYDGRPQPTFYARVTLNTVVAAISTIIRTLFMVPVAAAISQGAWIWFSTPEQRARCRSKLADLDTFDSASRGALGSLLLIFKIRFIHLASIGALITILTLGFDTFTQQLVSYHYRLVNSSSTDTDVYSAGAFPRTESWIDWWQNGRDFSDLTAQFPTKAAIYNGILTEGIAPLSVSCTSGNCTWPTIPSLAVCGECTPQNHTSSCNEGECEYIMSSGTSVSGLMETSFSEQTAFIVATVNSGGGTYNMSNITTPYLSVFELFGAPYEGSNFGYNTISVECALWFCIEAYSISVNNTIQIQTTANNWSTIEPIKNPLSNLNSNRNFTNIPDYMNVNPETNYSIGGEATTAYQNTLADIFEGNVTAGMASATFEYDNDFIQGIWNGTLDANTWIKNLALSMTNNIRTLGNTNNTAQEYAGTAQSSELFVHVRWAWIIFPLVLLILSMVFLGTSIVQTWRGDVDAWKGSPIAMLFADVDQNVKVSARGYSLVKDGVVGVVGKEKARLIFGGEGWRFASVG